MLSNPFQQKGPQAFSNANNTNQPDKKTLILGGGLMLVLIIIGLLLFGGGGAKNAKTWQDLVNNEVQITAISKKYSKDLSDRNLQNATATAAITWQTNNIDVEKVYAENLGKSAKPPSQIIYEPLAKDLAAAKTAGSLDGVFATSLLKQLNLIKSNLKILETANLGPKTKSQLDSTSKLTNDTIKLLQPYASLN